VAVATRSRVLADAVVGALEAMKADGSLKALFDRYGASMYMDKLETVGPQ
jgi:polar amino acid transport system substrate-binding protein